MMLFLHPLLPKTDSTITPSAKSNVSKNGDNDKGTETLLEIFDKEARSEIPKGANDSSARVKSVTAKLAGKNIGHMVALKLVDEEKVCYVVIYINPFFCN